MRELAPNKFFRFRTKGFLVYKWVFNDEDGCIAHWVEIKSLEMRLPSWVTIILSLFWLQTLLDAA
ncbi:hypothetical protein DVH24_037625 [Malus domestica]|uniref:Uncharacterized protein n=1 Tax=Malus domestica TaxID=3750 RepID=A0A498IXP4_MALDO|nr:hypothetical protein DVH24_037625 [Malus domestica]